VASTTWTQTPEWWREAQPPTFPELEGDHTADVVVVGAGITGLTTALLLAREGKRVRVLESGRVGGGTTGHTSAHLTVETDTDLDALRRRVGDEGARAAVQAGRKAIERIAALDQEMGGRSQFVRVPGYLWARTQSELDRIEKMAGLYVEYGEKAQAPVEVPLPNGRRGMRLDDQAMFHPVRYIAGLAELCAQAGVHIHESSEVCDWDSGTPTISTTRGGSVRAEHLVLATHTPPGMVPSVQTRLGPQMSFLITVHPQQPIPAALYWDMADPYHYVRPMPDGQLLVGGADFKPGNGNTDDALAELEEWARVELQAGAATARWTHMWFEPADGIPYIGRLPLRQGVWVGTGYSGTGLTWGTFAAERITAGILGQDTEQDKLFSPSRLQLLGSVDRMAKDQAEVMWHLVADRLRPSGDHHPKDLKPGEGRVLTVDGRKVGVYRDDSGELHAVSPVCKHMGCIVGWNALDRTWDCPCHGGRYLADGTRFWGPPMSNLERKKLE
jgi:glycine/D-amino acid oxidase-like deaminating enzyme/nitrite reductase/ring-hydroxylating ferredoxin subunit